MKKITYILSLLCLLTPMLLAGCAEEAVPITATQTGKSFVRVILRDNEVQTRMTHDPNKTEAALENDDIVGAFAVTKNDNNTYTPLTNDEIGIQCVNLQYKVVGVQTGLEGGGLEPVMSQDLLPYDGENSRYIFRYPFTEGTEFRNITHAVETDQSTESLYERSDLMWSCTSAVSDEGNPDFYVVFPEIAHAMSHITLDIDASLLNEQKAWVLNVGYIATGIDLTTEDDVALDYTVDTEHTANEIAMWCANSDINSGILHFRAVIPAQTISSGTKFLQINTVDGTNKVYTLPENLELVAGKEYLFKVTTNANTRSLTKSGKSNTTYIPIESLN